MSREWIIRRVDVILGVVVIFVATAALAGGVGAFVDSRSAERRTALEDQQRESRLASRAGCVRSLTDRAEGIQRDRDLAQFLEVAAAARRAEHQPSVAAKYDRVAARARARERSARSRMLGADPAPSRIKKDAPAACARAFPLPAPHPGP